MSTFWGFMIGMVLAANVVAFYYLRPWFEPRLIRTTKVRRLVQPAGQGVQGRPTWRDGIAFRLPRHRVFLLVRRR